MDQYDLYILLFGILIIAQVSSGNKNKSIKS